jgi:hypothetical protein
VIEPGFVSLLSERKNVMNVYQKLNTARKEFHTLQLKKTGLNKFAGYSYFELGDFLIPALNVFEKHGLCAFISFGKDIATMQIRSVDDGSFIELQSPMAEAALKGCHPIQNLGAVETYTRRYLWVAALEIVEHDALDSSEPVGGKVIKQGAKDGIGDDLPPEWKTYLSDLAAQLTNWTIKQGNPKKAKEVLAEAIATDDLDGDMLIWLERQLDSKVRTAMRNA